MNSHKKLNTTILYDMITHFLMCEWAKNNWLIKMNEKVKISTGARTQLQNHPLWVCDCNVSHFKWLNFVKFRFFI